MRRFLQNGRIKCSDDTSWLDDVKKDVEKRKDDEKDKIVRSIAKRKHETNSLESASSVLEQVCRDAKPLKMCEAKKKELANQWQCNTEVQNLDDKPWRNAKLRSLEEELLSRIRDDNSENAARSHWVRDVTALNPQFRKICRVEE